MYAILGHIPIPDPIPSLQQGRLSATRFTRLLS